jgi:hypothetical protein
MTQNFLAVFTGSKTSPKMQAWMAMSEDRQKARMVEGIALWKGWMEKHKDILVESGGPLGKTKKISETGIEDISNNLSGFVVIRADSPEAAAKLFVNHPHFAHFPGEAVEVMPVMPIPG